MLKRLFFSDQAFYLKEGVGIIRMIIGALMVYHGWELFDTQLMETYSTWDAFSGTNAKILVYFGKTAELIAGLLLLFGFLTRIGAFLLMGTLTYITFFVGSGKFWYEDQHPFLFVLFGLLFVFTGPGKWSLDRLIFD